MVIAVSSVTKTAFRGLNLSMGLLLSFHSHFASADSNECTLDCPLNAPCKFGNADLSGHTFLTWDATTIENNDSSIDGMHCDCPPHWTGIKCDRIYESCDDVSSPAPSSHFCYHGGKCIPGLLDKYGNTQLFCDCTDAIGTDGIRYTGKYCEIPSIAYCNKGSFGVSQDVDDDDDDDSYGGDDDDDLMFCVNGGECNPNYPNHMETPCLCQDGFEGLHCQYESGTVPTCDLECDNGGVCVLGVMDDSSTLSSLSPTNWSHMYCMCPSNYNGVFCENEQIPCGDDYCYHGGACITTFVTVESDDSDDDGALITRRKQYHCDCSTATSDDHFYAGRHCEYASTTYCNDNYGSSDGRDGLLRGDLFCVNGGTCKEESHMGCDCPDGYIGFKCEFQDDNDRDVVDDDDNDDDDKFKDDLDENEMGQQPEPVLCGDQYCFNGGTCHKTEINTDGETRALYTCDCSTAFDKDNGRYSGTSCQYKSTDLCTIPNDSGDFDDVVLFCVNGGTCKDNALQGCDCPDGWIGSKCEFHTPTVENDDEDDDNSTVPCGDDLHCLNGGTCNTVKIVQEDGSYKEEFMCDCSTAFDDEYLYAGTSCQHKSTTLCTQPDDDDASLKGSFFCVNHGQCKDRVNEGCDCPEAFTGLRCEYETTTDETYDSSDSDIDRSIVDPCGDAHVCHNGGTCDVFLLAQENVDVEERQHCDCSTAYNDKDIYAGDKCQYKATSFCTDPTEEQDLGDVYFCVNGGACKDIPQQGCDCPTGWSGFHCEFETPKDDLDETDEKVEACGDHFCLNGGKCMNRRVTNPDGTFVNVKHCDCSMAFTDTDIYAGYSCEHKATLFCTQPDEGESLEGVMFCANGGQCSNIHAYSQCDCEGAWTGYHCEFEVPAEDIISSIEEPDKVNEFVECGEDFCFHGGSCAEFWNNGERSYSCDCSTAITDTALYAGEFCQYKSTSFCTLPNSFDDGLSGVEFCVNGGKCKEDPYAGCECPAGYRGSRCQFKLYEGQIDPEDNIEPDSNDETNDGFKDSDYAICHLECQNGGTCAKGAKDHGYVEEIVENVGFLNETYHTEYFEHCVCPDGYMGVECDVLVDICGDNEHACFHGSVCEKQASSNGEDRYGCDCSSAFMVGDFNDPKNRLFAGSSCQHQASDVCTIGSPPLGGLEHFCVNEGVCKYYVSGDDTGHPGCVCVNGWTGQQCEIKVETLLDTVDKKTAIAAIVSAILISGIFTFLLVFWCCRQAEDDSQTCMILRRRRPGHAGDKKISADELVSNTTDSVADSSGQGDLTLFPDEEPQEPYYDKDEEQNSSGVFRRKEYFKRSRNRTPTAECFRLDKKQSNAEII